MGLDDEITGFKKYEIFNFRLTNQIYEHGRYYDQEVMFEYKKGDAIQEVSARIDIIDNLILHEEKLRNIKIVDIDDYLENVQEKIYNITKNAPGLQYLINFNSIRKEYLSNGKKGLEIDLVTLRNRRPINKFSNFHEEKEFEKIKDFTYGWQEINDVDDDIKDLVRDINRTNFVYTEFPSCSGSYKDHDNQYYFFYNGFQPQSGFILLRLDKSNSNIFELNNELSNMEGIRIREAKSTEIGKYQLDNNVISAELVLKVPDSILDPSHPKHKTYMTKKWDSIKKIVQKYI